MPRRGVVLDRSTLAHWTGLGPPKLLKPVHARLLERLKASGQNLFADETRAPVLDPRARPHP